MTANTRDAKIKRLFRRVRHRLRRGAELRASERWHHEHSDQRDNAATALPEGERVDWPCFWLAELYAPSHTPALESGMEELGHGGGGLFPNYNLADWVRDARSWTGGYLNVGFFAQPGRYPGGGSQKVGLPEEFAFMQASVRQIAPGITVFTAQFALEEEHRRCLNDVMEQSFSTKAVPLKRHTGHSIIQPDHRKEDLLGEVRDRYRSLAKGWMKDHVPGLFSSDDRLAPPAWDFLLTQQEELFHVGDTKDRWRGVLGFGEAVDRWASDDLPGLQLLEHFSRERSRAVPTFAGTETAALRILEGQHSGDTVDGLVQYLDRHVGDLLALWTVKKALDAHERQFTRIRDELAPPPKWYGTGRRLKRLRREVMPLAFDLETLRDASQNETALEIPVRYSGLDFTWVETRPRRKADQSLMGRLREMIADEGESVASQGREISSALRVQGELLLAASNIRLQWVVLALTLLVGAGGIYATIAG